MEFSLLKKIDHRVVLGAVLLIAFLSYTAYRQEYVGASDWYGYYQESLLLKTGRFDLPLERNPTEYPSIVPLGFFEKNGLALPQYPPGLPALLALASFVRLEFFVLPLAGVLSCWYLFLICRDFTDRSTALVFALLWSFFPIVTFSSTGIMSDIMAALTLIAAFYHYRHGAIAVSALIFGFGVSVRPTNIFFIIPLFLLLLRDKKIIAYGLWLMIPASIYGWYNWQVFGKPWTTGYGSLGSDLISTVFSSHSKFYLWETTVQMSPWVLALSLLGLRKFSLEKLFLVLWFLLFFLFYCFWKSGGDRWWWTRFLLPGYPALFILAAIGFTTCRTWIERKIAKADKRRQASVALTILLACTSGYYLKFGLGQVDLWKKNKGEIYRDVALDAASLLPRGGYVGSAEFGGSVRIYAPGYFSFLSVHANSISLLDKVFDEDGAAVLIVEPWNTQNELIIETLRRFRGEQIKVIKIWGDVTVYRLKKPLP